METLPTFSLPDLYGSEHVFPNGRHSLLCFVKEACATCKLSVPIFEAVFGAFGGAMNVWLIGQEDNEALVRQHGATIPILDDTALKVSFNFEIEFVPTMILADQAGAQMTRWYAFHKEDWKDLIAQMAQLSGLPAPEIDWDAFPGLRPGCGSKSVEPGIVERLTSEAEGSPLRAKLIEIAEKDDPFEFMFDQGLTDGLPVVPPTPERVLRMLASTRRDPQEIIGTCAPNYSPVSIEKVAINSVMSGCKPEYLPVVIAATEAMLTHEFNAHFQVSTSGPAVVIIVNGPIRHKLDMNMGINVFGQGNRANATIGRAVRLILRNIGGLRPGEIERATHGSPGKYGACYPEYEERNPWEPLHVERGFDRNDSVVTLFALDAAPIMIIDQDSRTARALAGSLGLGMEGVFHPKFHGLGESMLVISPEHADTLSRDGWSKDDVRRRIQEVTARPLRELMPNENYGGMVAMTGPASAYSEEELNRLLPKFATPKCIHIIVAGGDAGKYSRVLGGMGVGDPEAEAESGGSHSVPVSRKIEEW